MKAWSENFNALSRDIDAEGHGEYWLKGGRGSGKSTFIARKILLGMLTHPQASAVVYRTDQMGDVVAVSDGQRFLFSTGARRATQQHPADASGDAASEGGGAEGTAAEGDAAAAGTSEEAAEAAAQGYKYTSMKQFVDALPEGTAFIGNTRTKKFHSLDCPSVKAMKGKNATALASVEQAHELGYTPCGTCNPG